MNEEGRGHSNMVVEHCSVQRRGLELGGGVEEMLWREKTIKSKKRIKSIYQSEKAEPRKTLPTRDSLASTLAPFLSRQVTVGISPLITLRYNGVSSVWGGGGGVKLDNLAQIKSVGWQHMRVDNKNKQSPGQCGTASHPINATCHSLVNGLIPTLSTASIEAPWSTKSSTILPNPFSAATWSGVWSCWRLVLRRSILLRPEICIPQALKVRK